ncbi:MAG: Asp/Glu racemase [Pseudomonadota bacterium]
MSYEIAPEPAARLGLVVLSTDETLEDEARAIMGPGPSIYHTRIESAPSVTPESLAAMEARMVNSASLLPAGLDAIGYGCTSASVVIGPEAVAAQKRAVQPGVPVTNPISAVMAGLDAVGAKRIAMVTPYATDVVAPMRAFLERHGFEVLSERSFDERDDRRVPRISEQSTLKAMREAVAAAEGVEAVFSSCTNLRSFGIIDAAEAELGVPVISSNSGLLWHLARLGGVERIHGPGRLFSL